MTSESEDAIVKFIEGLIKEAQRQAVEKTKQACWEWFANHEDSYGQWPDNEKEHKLLFLDGEFSKEEFAKALTPEKILFESEKEGEGCLK